MTKNQTPTAPEPAPTIATSPSTSIPLVAMALGIASLIPFMWLLGIPAIITGIIALKKYTINRGYSITGIVTGAISTLVMIAAVIFLFVAVAVAVSSELDPTPTPRQLQEEQQQEDYRDYYYRYDRG